MAVEKDPLLVLIPEYSGGTVGYIYYDRETKVMYVVNRGYESSFMPLYNADGTLKTYEKDIDSSRLAE